MLNNRKYVHVLILSFNPTRCGLICTILWWLLAPHEPLALALPCACALPWACALPAAMPAPLAVSVPARVNCSLISNCCSLSGLWVYSSLQPPMNETELGWKHRGLSPKSGSIHQAQPLVCIHSWQFILLTHGFWALSFSWHCTGIMVVMLINMMTRHAICCNVRGIIVSLGE